MTEIVFAYFVHYNEIKLFITKVNARNVGVHYIKFLVNRGNSKNVSCGQLKLTILWGCYIENRYCYE
jgi:hypothetical protein